MSEEQLEMIKEIPHKIITVTQFIHKKALEIQTVEMKRKLSKEQIKMIDDEVNKIIDSLCTSHNKLHEILEVLDHPENE